MLTIVLRLAELIRLLSVAYLIIAKAPAIACLILLWILTWIIYEECTEKSLEALSFGVFLLAILADATRADWGSPDWRLYALAVWSLLVGTLQIKVNFLEYQAQFRG